MQIIKTNVRFTKLPHYVENPANLTYATEGSACFDICAAIDKPLTIKCGEHIGVPTGVKIAAEAPLWFRINSRSGLAIKHGIITIAGIIDTDYRGEWIVGLLNTNAESSGKSYTINPGDKIAQVELPFPYKAEFSEISPEEFATLSTVRGEGGFGSSGR
ncbi:MAG: dUTP diphosphatase [Alphaproteobacteria bacterium]|nr:dUTP diphosphatase [Alphaproteobacteria bacterium]